MSDAPMLKYPKLADDPEDGEVGPSAIGIHEPPPGYDQPTTIVAQPQVVYVQTISLNEYPQRMVCPHCQTDINTIIQPQVGLLTWLICGGMALVGCGICCCLPFCIDRCQDVEHRCPKCQAYLGTYKRV